MSVPNFIENLRAKPDSHKKRIQIMVSVAVTFIVVILWAFSFGSQVKTIVDAGKIDNKPSPFRVLANSFMGIFTNIGDGVNITADRLKGEEEKTQNDGANMMYVKE